MNTMAPHIGLFSRRVIVRFTILSTLFFGFASSWSLAQGVLTGTVTNAATGRTLEGAVVEIRGTDREAITDRQGVYRIENVPAGVVTLVTSYTGLKADVAQVEVTAGTTNRDVGLTADIYLMSKLVVSGEREGQAQAITLQKLSAGVKSVISTDAFGNLAGNPADLLVRLPGVEGVYCSDNIRYVQIRGLNNNLTTVTMDGNRLADAASAGATRQFQFQTISSDTISRVEVVKSPTPDMDGDSIGGAVNMVSKSAFDSSPERRVRLLFGATSRFLDPRPKRFPPNFAISYSEVFAKKLAVAFNYSFRELYTLSDYMSLGYEQLPNGVVGPAYRYTVGLTDYRERTTRRGGGIRFDYKISENMRVYLNGTLNFITEHEFDSYVTWATNQGVATRDASGNLTGTNGIVPGYTEDRTEVRAVPNSNIAVRSTNPYKDGKTQYIQTGGVNRYGHTNIDYNAYASNSKTNYAAQKMFTITERNIGFVIQSTADPFFPSVTQTAGPDWTKISSYTENTYSRSGMAGWDRYRGGSINVKQDFTAPVPAYLKAGVRFRGQTRRLAAWPWTGMYVGPDGVMGPNPATGINDDNLAQFGTTARREMAAHSNYYPDVPQPAHPSSRFSGVDSEALERAFKNTPQYFVQNIAANLQTQLTGNQRFKEDITAYYLMGNVDLGKLSILSGVRIERTKVEGEGALQVITPEEKARRAAYVGAITDAENIRRTLAEFGGRQTRTGDNQHVLPGVHFKYSPIRNLVARASYATNIGRPSIGQLIPRTNVNYDNQTVSSSNPSLKPQTADNFDLGAEYYFEPAGVVSVGLFMKQLKNFIYNSGGTIIPAGADNGFGGEYAGYIYTSQANGGSAKIRGIELNYMQQFTFLPGIWAGLGAFGNVTRMIAEGNYGNGNAIALAPTPKIAGFNPFLGNLGLSYIRNKITLRAQATYRARFLTTYNVNESRMTYARSTTRVDLKSLYQLSRHIELYLDANNIVPDKGAEGNRDTGGRPSAYGWSGTLFSFGVNMRL